MPPSAGIQLPPTSLFDILIALALGTALSVLTSWQYVRHGRTFTNRESLAYTLPIITLTVILIISVVKASLALSLGLVGALSIVRFRTPIREPEELGYLFIAIAVGIGLGAGQILPTTTATLVILGVASLRTQVWRRSPRRNLFLNVDVRSSSAPGEEVFQKALSLLGGIVIGADLRRLDVAADTVQIALQVKVADDASLMKAIAALRSGLAGDVTVTFVDQDSTAVSA